MPLKDKVKNATKPIQRSKPLWEGLNGEGKNGGITYSLLSRFLVCRERFRVHAVEGLHTRQKFNHLMDFGNMWHVCEEHFIAGKPYTPHLIELTRKYIEKYPFQQEEIRHWYSLCEALFPVYIDYWRKHPDVLKREHLFGEETFDVLYTLPSGRTVRLRGKWDGGDIVEDEFGKGVWLQENKTKSSIDQIKIERQLKFDLQTMFYIIALETKKSDDFWRRSNKRWRDLPIRGVRYNVVRRSAHKSPESMLKKCIEDIGAGRGGEWFNRWNTEINDYDVKVFKDTCLNPILEFLSDWWARYTDDGTPLKNSDGTLYQTPLHWRHPFGVYNVLDEGGSSDVDAYLADGSEVGLYRANNLFPELQE